MIALIMLVEEFEYIHIVNKQNSLHLTKMCQVHPCGTAIYGVPAHVLQPHGVLCVVEHDICVVEHDICVVEHDMCVVEHDMCGDNV